MFTFCGKYFGLDSALCFQVFTGFSGVAVFFVAEGVHISGGLGDGRSPVGLRGTSAVRVLLPCPRRKNKTLDL